MNTFRPRGMLAFTLAFLASNIFAANLFLIKGRPVNLDLRDQRRLPRRFGVDRFCRQAPVVIPSPRRMRISDG